MAKRTISQSMPANFVVVFVMNTNETEPHRLNTCGWRRSRAMRERLRRLA
jgi:hypothetical protein